MTREEAIKIFNTVLFFGKCDCPKEEIEECLKMAIKAIEQEPCEDAVSRQAVEKITWEEPSYSDALNVLTEVRDKVRALPPVTPTRKKGHWIEEPNSWLRCSCCNSHYPHTSIYAIRGSNYCPNCGAEMEI